MEEYKPGEGRASTRFDLTGKVAVITGAGRGIGKSITLGLAEHGADVVICSRTSAQLEKVAQEVRKLGRKALPMPLDVSQVCQLDGLVVETKKAFGHIDVLVNVAAVASIVDALAVDQEVWDSVMDINVKGLFFSARKLAR